MPHNAVLSGFALLTFAKTKNDVQKKKYNLILKIIPCDTAMYIMDHSGAVICSFMDSNIIYIQTEVKHHPNIISETFFAYKLFQKNNQYVIFRYPCLPVVC